MRGFVERGVCGLRQDHFGLCDLRVFGACLVARRLDGEHDAFRSAAGEMSHCVRVTAQEIDHRPHDVRLHFEQGGEDRRIESVLVEISQIRFARHLGRIFARIVDIAPDLPRLPIHIAGLERLQCIENFFFRKTLSWDIHLYLVGRVVNPASPFLLKSGLRPPCLTGKTLRYCATRAWQGVTEKSKNSVFSAVILFAF
jgi:hypothetical protein